MTMKTEVKLNKSSILVHIFVSKAFGIGHVSCRTTWFRGRRSAIYFYRSKRCIFLAFFENVEPFYQCRSSCTTSISVRYLILSISYPSLKPLTQEIGQNIKNWLATLN